MSSHGPSTGSSAVDWNSWKPPGKGDVRSPCPAINALANHGILPHDGKNITKEMAVKALSRAFNLDEMIGKVFAFGAVAANPNHAEHSFNLDHVNKHGWIEHDVSLSRDDVAFGDQVRFNKQRWDEILAVYKDVTRSEGGATGVGPEQVDIKSASKARYMRVKQSKDRHENAAKDFNYGLKEVILSYGESALFINLLGMDEKVPLPWLRIFFEEERLPFKEGWRPPTRFDQNMMNRVILQLMKENERLGDEAVMAGLGTVHALQAAVRSLIRVPSPSMCSIM